jgi:hypothetical protein
MFLEVFKIYTSLLSIHPLIVLAAIVAAFWFLGRGWGFGLLLFAVLLYGPLIAIPIFLQYLTRTSGKIETNK